jgi:DDE superfamily endonuclease
VSPVPARQPAERALLRRVRDPAGRDVLELRDGPLSHGQVLPRRRVALYLRCRSRNLSGLDIRAFLQHLLRHLRGPIDLLWDRGSIHRRREVRAFLGEHPRLIVHYFPAYAPELNPAEYVWAQADHQLANGVPDDLGELRQRLDGATRRLRRSRKLLWSCIYASDLPWAR